MGVLGPGRRPPPRPGRGRPAGRRPARRCGRRRHRAPAAEAPTLSTATPIPRSAQAASASASFAPSPSDSRNRATEPTPSRSASAASQSLASQTAWLPVETTVCQRMPRREPSALTPTLPLWVTIATRPGSQRPDRVAPDRRAASATATIPLPFGPQTGSPAASAIRAQLGLDGRGPDSTSPKPAAKHDAPPQPRSATVARSAAATPAAGIATTTRVDRLGQVGDRRARSGARAPRSRFGFTPQTGPRTRPARGCEARCRRRSPGRSVAPTTATDRGASSGRQVQLDAASRIGGGERTAQWRIRSTPRRSSPRATISRWISLVPSQIRSTRSSRSSRSATFERR